MPLKEPGGAAYRPDARQAALAGSPATALRRWRASSYCRNLRV